MYHICPFCRHTLGTSDCGHCTLDKYVSSDCRVCHPCRMHSDNEYPLKRCITCLKGICNRHIEEFLCNTCHNVLCKQWQSTQPSFIRLNPFRPFNRVVADWACRGFYLMWEEVHGSIFDRLTNMKLWFLRHKCEFSTCTTYDYNEKDYYIAVVPNVLDEIMILEKFIERDQLESQEFFTKNMNSTINYTKRRYKAETRIYCTKCDPDYSVEDEYVINPNKLEPLFISETNDYAPYLKL